MKTRSIKGTPSGFRDLLPSETLLKEYVVRKISDVYKNYGFLPIETPIVEYLETLIDEVTDFNLFIVEPTKTRKTGAANSLALRFDQTVPLARFIAENQQIKKPFKRYVYGPVFRGERPQSGRYRQFDQFDADTVGTSDISADIEIILMMRDVFYAIGLDNFVIKVNTRKLLNALPKIFDFPENKLKKVLIALDKRDKISTIQLKELLINEELSENSISMLVEFGGIHGDPAEIMEQLYDICKNVPEAQEGMNDLQTITDVLSSVSKTGNIIFDMSVIRGLSYYTGTIFETQLLDALEFGSVYSGGRYDNLVENFGVLQQPAVGASVGVDRLVSALVKIGFQPESKSASVLILVNDPSNLVYAFLVAEKIRATNRICEVYTGNKKRFGEQFTYADERGYLYACIIGQIEKETRTIKIKNLKTKKEDVYKYDSFDFKED